MKILVVCQHYWPEPYRLSDFCEEMVRRGHQVHVITDVPNYPMGYIYDGYTHGENRHQEKDGVTITRTYTIGRRHDVIHRILNYFSFAISSTHYARHLKEEYDVVFTNQTSPVMMVNAALAYAAKHHKKCVLYCMDLWPASLAAGGIGVNSPVYKVFGWISGRLYRRADRILITSQMFRQYLAQQHSVESSRIQYLPQYADSGFDTALPFKEVSPVTELMFAGNIGTAQSIPTIIGAAKLLQDSAQIRWHIVGDGSELENMKQLASSQGLSNVIFHGRKPAEEMPEYFAMADAMLVTLTSDPFISLTLPGKVQNYMAAGKPILAAATGEIPKVLEDARCGFCAEPDNAESLARAVQAFLNTPDRKKLGDNARSYYEAHFTRSMFMDHLEAHLKESAGFRE